MNYKQIEGLQRVGATKREIALENLCEIWPHSTNTKYSDQQKAAFREGFRQGWNIAIETMEELKWIKE